MTIDQAILSSRSTGCLGIFILILVVIVLERQCNCITMIIHIYHRSSIEFYFHIFIQRLQMKTSKVSLNGCIIISILISYIIDCGIGIGIAQ